MKYVSNSVLILAALLAAVSCSTTDSSRTVPRTWEQAVSLAVTQAKTGNYSYIINNMLAPELKQQLINQHGKKNWKKKFTDEKLKRLPYFYGWLKGGKVEQTTSRTNVRGQFGCYAGFVNIGGRYYLCDFGQTISSM